MISPCVRTRLTYLSIPIDDFGYRPQIILRGVGRRHFPVCSQKDSRLTLPWMKYFEILTQHYVWSNREFEEFPASFVSSKTYFIQLFGILTSNARIFVRKYYVAYMKYHAPFLRTSVVKDARGTYKFVFTVRNDLPFLTFVFHLIFRCHYSIAFAFLFLHH